MIIWEYDDGRMCECETHDMIMWMWTCDTATMWNYEIALMSACTHARFWECNDVRMWGGGNAVIWNSRIELALNSIEFMKIHEF